MPLLDSLPHNKFVCLVILDGWGIAPDGPGNAITQAKTPNMKRFWHSFPHTQLQASGEAVGLPRGEVGNTETGHLNLGAGRIVYQDLARINMAIADGSFFTNKVLQEATDYSIKNGSNLHLMGLIGAGGVHSNMEHLFALIQLAASKGCKNLFLHLFTDGRDSPPTSAKGYISQVTEIIKKEGVGQIASISGRYWAMDRDLRWERTQKAYLALTQGEGNLVKTPEEAIEISYSQGKTDEFIEPSLVCDTPGQPIALIKDGDSVIFFNFRIDRPRQLSRAFVFEDFSKESLKAEEYDPYLIDYAKKHIVEQKPTQKPFARGPRLKNLYFVMMTEYSRSLSESGAKTAFPPYTVAMPLGRVVAEAGKKQLRVTESEKERFIGFYFNGGQEKFPQEERFIVPSPKVATYDLKPEMSAYQITEAVLNYLKTRLDYSFILINFANADMVGHTGNLKAAFRACEVVDECMGKIASYIQAVEGTLVITADHGNAEEMINLKTGGVDTEHSINPVPFIAINNELLGKSQNLTSGILADVAPTVISLLGLTIPTPMTGRDLLKSVWR
ncbi:phosphoglycerate mutase (2,3-diphosphoglycerate-independent) [Candidatus Woesebacteria bacterium GWA1_41_8]|uniref:2,3-bisphosphoglycerate-independent phosphoglycerate mutase n=1 Tax=Candidatus Woesebacteria bacterium GWA1_41_8 TaxID=1802471 RepID=A0A1F7WH80_9BACT|nr:MAG: phosphoglycerate mutase (2,3-diphosphoglycerate-independent) [Candidatus Woesebacteria bacterium GWA1_41_8]